MSGPGPRPGSWQLAHRLAEYAVLLYHPEAQNVAVDYWQDSVDVYRQVLSVVTDVLGNDAQVTDALAGYAAAPQDGRAELALERALADAIADTPATAQALRCAVGDADARVLIRYHRGLAFDHAHPAPVVQLDDLRGYAAARPVGGEPAGADRDVLVIIPIRDRTGGSRLRNLLACLLALRDQSVPAERSRVVVVESDDEPRCRPIVTPLCDDYLFVPDAGSFNKSWTMNVGARHATGASRTPPVLCFLDADIIADTMFVERNLSRLAAAEHDAHLPYRDMTCLDGPSSDLAIAERVYQQTRDVDRRRLRAMVLREPPGGCLWITAALFDKVGGYDERYQGWGGEDDDMVARVAAAGRLVRYDDVFVHLAHPRPAMERDGQPFNAHIPPMSWRREYGFGSLSGPARPPLMDDAEATT